MHLKFIIVGVHLITPGDFVITSRPLHISGPIKDNSVDLHTHDCFLIVHNTMYSHLNEKNSALGNF